jgi:hypothetical protein
MSDVENLTVIEQQTGGAKIPDATHHLSEIISAALMVPMGHQGPSDPNCHMGLPIILWGPSGIAKSDKVNQGAQRLGLPLRIIFPGQKQPEEFGELPVVLNNQLMSACMLSQVNELNSLQAQQDEQGNLLPPVGGVLIIDEASCATPATQGAMLGMSLNRTVGATAIHPTIRQLYTANPPAYAAGGWGLEPPFANRMAHFYTMCPPVEEWSNWLITEGTQQVTPIQGPMNKLRANWDLSWATIKGHLTGFMRDRQILLHGQPKPDHPQSGYCWNSPRTWVMAGKAIATIRAMGMNEELEQMFAEACVGMGPAAEWYAWLATADLTPPEEALKNGWRINRDRLDQVMAIASSMTAYVVSIGDKKEKYKMATLCWTRLQDLIDAGLSDIALKFAMTLSEHDCGYSNREAPTAMKKAAQPILNLLSDGKTGVADFIEADEENKSS